MCPGLGSIEETAGVPASGAQLIASGTLPFSDADAFDFHTVSNPASQLGTLTATLVSDTTNGTGGLIGWEYTVDAAAVEFLGEGEQLVEAFDVAVDDGHGGVAVHTVTITINGSDVFLLT